MVPAHELGSPRRGSCTLLHILHTSSIRVVKSYSSLPPEGIQQSEWQRCCHLLVLASIISLATNLLKGALLHAEQAEDRVCDILLLQVCSLQCVCQGRAHMPDRQASPLKPRTAEV